MEPNSRGGNLKTYRTLPDDFAHSLALSLTLFVGPGSNSLCRFFFLGLIQKLQHSFVFSPPLIWEAPVVPGSSERLQIRWSVLVRAAMKAEIGEEDVETVRTPSGVFAGRHPSLRCVRGLGG